MRTFSWLGLLVLAFVLPVFGPERQILWAATGELTTPAVSFPTEYPQAKRDQVNSVLASSKVEFVGGNWLNFFTRLDYRGDTKALNVFLDELVQCHDVSVHVSFARPGSASYLSELDWSISHWAGKNHFHVTINLDSDRIDLTSLYLPDMGRPVE